MSVTERDKWLQGRLRKRALKLGSGHTLLAAHSHVILVHLPIHDRVDEGDDLRRLEGETLLRVAARRGGRVTFGASDQCECGAKHMALLRLNPGC